MRNWIAKRPATSYYVLTIIFTWGYWFALIAQGMQVGPGSNATHLPGLLGPLLSAFVITACVDGKSGVFDMVRRMVRWRTAWPWGLLVALSPLPLAGLIFLSLYLLGTPLPPLHEFQAYPGLPAGLPLWLIIVVVLVVNGYGEEVGWRGFLMDRLLLRYDRFQTTLLVAVLWIIWHIPVFWVNQTMSALVGPMLLGWAVGVVCGAFVLAHLYLFSGRSILVLAIWHTAFNLMVATPAGTGFPAAAVSTAVMIWGALIAWKWWRDSRA